MLELFPPIITFKGADIAEGVLETSTGIVSFRLGARGGGVDEHEITVKWGDDTWSSASGRSGTLHHFSHEWENAGTYVVDIVARSGSAVAKQSRVITVVKEPEEDTVDMGWRGLALPQPSAQEALEVLRDVFPVTTTTLSSDVRVGDSAIAVDDAVEFLSSGDTVTINNGGFVSFARVLEVNGNVIKLDAPVKHDYTSGTSVEIKRSNVSREFGALAYTKTSRPWRFPTSADKDLIKSAIYMILSTDTGERLMLPTFGSELRRIPFEMSDDVTRALLERTVADALGQWEPRAELVSLSSWNDGNALGIKTTYILAGQQGTFDLEMAMTE